MWIAVAFEEGLKAFGAQEQKATDRFWLISLFGLWELTLDKPFWGLMMWHEVDSWTRIEIGALLYATVLPVLMHCVTAAIYAFRWQGRLWAAFAVCWLLHVAFNEAVTYFGLSLTTALIETMLLLAVLVAALPQSSRPTWLALRSISRRGGLPS